MDIKQHKYEKPIFIVCIVLAVLGLLVGGYFYKITYEGILKNISDSEIIVAGFGTMNASLLNSFRAELYLNSTFSSQIGQLSNTVDKLDTLSKTDKELLQKYSKVYFLNENYVPEELTQVPPDFVAETGKEIQFHTKAFPYLQNMIVDAKAVGINLKIISGYRSFGEQSDLKSSYLVTYGSGANKFSADQGYSEHQLGTAIDFTTSELGLDFSSFEKTDAYNWLTLNAYKYGFVLSYPKGNAYYQFEPWHWRFVGRSLANMLHQENENFYDVPQRTIDSYLISIFN